MTRYHSGDRVRHHQSHGIVKMAASGIPFEEVERKRKNPRTEQTDLILARRVAA
jgi:hypothetical protein